MKKHMTKFVSALVVLAAIFNCAYTPDPNNKLTAKEQAAGWKLLFDGHSTAGWHLYNSQAAFTAWKAKDGELFCDPQDKSGPGDMITDKEYKNFDLKFDWKLPKGGNSGVFINVLERNDIPAGWASGPEYQLLDDAHPDYAKPQSRSGCLYGFAPQKNPVKSKPSDTWNHSEIKQKNGKVQFYLNGVLTAEEDFASTAWAKKVADSHFKGFPEFGKHINGHIALQDWATGISFRNIKIREL
ncbi:DUF1080 domain-containing protein [Mucilaginibacter sabulilitoris]|uniref:DUF1080 domain-containing protein n=1 Tax=Mucilaginibacter sabulilitoris TaxID=1173583 RepID=A0ABZ0TLQ9_9SPHI|nr:DUF1080 domain-containing protein [Mucilaginibacter sabulilitoris]WPU93128.1 DUF1080 domain-containing protein [Mucilaginibacter sabulilitoris]